MARIFSSTAIIYLKKLIRIKSLDSIQDSVQPDYLQEFTPVFSLFPKLFPLFLILVCPSDVDYQYLQNGSRKT